MTIIFSLFFELSSTSPSNACSGRNVCPDGVGHLSGNRASEVRRTGTPVTGASRGLGLASSKAFAETGASLFISSNDAAALEKAKAELQESFQVPVASAYIDVTDEASVKAGVDECIKTYGKIDVVISNAGGGDAGGVIGQVPVDSWWGVQELNVKGTFNVASHTVLHLRETKGYFIILSSLLALLRFPQDSAYNMAKSSLIRLTEWIHLDHNEHGVKAVAIHPGAVLTDLSIPLVNEHPELAPTFKDSRELSAWTEVRLVSGSEDWLSGRFYDSTWGFDQVEKYKSKILDEDALKTRLAVPHSV